MQVTPFDPAYFDRVVSLYIEVFQQAPWFQHLEQPKVETLLDSQLANNKFRGYLALSGSDLIGACYGFDRPWYEGLEFYIEEFFIAPTAQRHGVGTEFLIKIQADLSEQNISGMMLLTMPHSPAQKFYEKNGFEADHGAVVMYRSF